MVHLDAPIVWRRFATGAREVSHAKPGLTGYKPVPQIDGIRPSDGFLGQDESSCGFKSIDVFQNGVSTRYNVTVGDSRPW